MSLLEITTYGRNTLRRRRQEARLVAATPFPGLARACERDPLSPTASLVTEYVPDVSLDDLVSIAPLPAAAALHALQDVAGTLDAMHECGLVHGDLRPATVYVLPDGRSALAHPGEMPPASATRQETARRNDAHAFAMLAFELLTGDHPHDVQTAIARAPSLPTLPRAAALALKRALTATPARRPRPLELVATLDTIPAEDWPTNRLRRAAVVPLPAEPPVARRPEAPDAERWAPREGGAPVEAEAEPEVEVGVETEPVALRPPTATSPVVVRIVPAQPRKRRLRRFFEMFVIILGLATVLAGGGVGAWLLFAPPTASAGDDASGRLEVQGIALTVTPPQVHCPRASLHLTAAISIEGGAGELELQWRLPNGSIAETDRFSVDDGEETVHAALDLTLRGKEQVIDEVVAVVSPGDAQATIPLRYLCPTGDQPAPPPNPSA
ncbi:hypothetical protein [Nocardioides antri]|uniref:Protein kinase domain-containing protein n=1 Tax=Nocardioides antri TaxID=2607659 RepID=A0A5B1M9S3_9ACTN|nr:hypothetical protein [Nocardioides antri]KAA1428460.1 hypothetical protein F0U47_05960 [Nocardioides antri]